MRFYSQNDQDHRNSLSHAFTVTVRVTVNTVYSIQYTAFLIPKYAMRPN